MNKFLSFAAGLLALALAIPPILASAQDAAPVEKGAARPFDYRLTELENGLRIISLEDFSAPIAAVQLWYHVGSKNEEPMRHGFAHMFEHMMFQGTENLSNTDHFDYISQVGGNTNAYTAFDQTVYLANIPADQLEMVLWLEAERMGFLGIDDDAFAIERKVVEEELRNGREAPYGEVAEKLLAEIFPDLPYAWSPGGSIAHLRDATSADLQTFWETYYVPNNATLVVTGAVSHEDVEALGRKYFEWIPRGAEPPRPEMKPVTLTEPKHIEIEERSGPVPIVGLGVRIPGMGHKDYTALQMMGTILGGGASSRLHRRLVNDEELAVAAGAAAQAFEGAGIAGAFAVVNPLGGDPAKAMKALEEEIEKLKKDGVTAEEFEKARAQMLRAEVTQLLTISSKASALGQAAVLLGDVEEVNRGEAAIRAVTAEDIKRVANTYLDQKQYHYVTIKPNLLGMALGKLMGGKSLDDEDAPIKESPEGAIFGQGKPGLERPEWWGPKPPLSAVQTPDVNIARIEKSLPNGLQMVVVENHEVPFVTMTLGMKAGAYTEPDGLPGTANFASELLLRGTENYTYEEMSEELDRYAISLNAGVSMDGGTVSASSLREEAPRAFKLMSEAVRRPTFPEDEFEKLVKQTKTSKQIEEKSPDYIADRKLRETVYEGHPYQRSSSGELSDVDKLKLEEINTWWTNYVRPETTVLYVAGAISDAEAYALAKDAFGDWKPEGDVPSLKVADLPANKDRKIYLVDKPGANQSQIRMGHLAPGRSSEHYHAMRVLTDIFGGGGLDTRINKVLRVEKGLTYGAYGGFFPSRFEGRFFISTFSKTESTVEAVKVILDEVDRMREEPPTEEEMRKSIDSIVGGFGLSRETPQSIVQDLWTLELNDLPTDYYEKYIAGISSMTSERVDKAASTLIDPSKLSIVIVGDAKKIKKGLEEIAEVVVSK